MNPENGLPFGATRRAGRAGVPPGLVDRPFAVEYAAAASGGGPAYCYRERWTPDGLVEWSFDPRPEVPDVRFVVHGGVAVFDDGTQVLDVEQAGIVLPTGTFPFPDVAWARSLPAEVGLPGATADVALLVERGVFGPLVCAATVRDGVITGIGDVQPADDPGVPRVVVQLRLQHLLAYLAGRMWFRELLGVALGVAGDPMHTAAFSGLAESPEALAARDARWFTNGLLRLCALVDQDAYLHWRRQRVVAVA